MFLNLNFPASFSLSKYELQEESRNLEEEPEAAGMTLSFYWRKQVHIQWAYNSGWWNSTCTSQESNWLKCKAVHCHWAAVSTNMLYNWKCGLLLWVSVVLSVFAPAVENYCTEIVEREVLIMEPFPETFSCFCFFFSVLDRCKPCVWFKLNCQLLSIWAKHST